MPKQVLSELQERRLKGPTTGKGTKVTRKSAPKPKEDKKERPFSAHEATKKIRKRNTELQDILDSM